MTKQEKQNTTRTILRQIENAYRDMGKFLGKLKKTDKVEIFEQETTVTYMGHVYPYDEDGEASETDFYLETEDGQNVEFSVWQLVLDRSYFDNENNVLTLVAESVEVK